MTSPAKPTPVFPQTVEVPQPLEIHPSVSPLAAELLMKTAEILARSPERYDQQNCLNVCHSPCCIVGHMRIIAGKPESWEPGDVSLTEPQFDRIFKFVEWPEQFWAATWAAYYASRDKGDVYKAITSFTPVSSAIARIEHFLRTGE